MIFSELGALLYERRVQRNISVDDVSAHLKISSRLIRDIESGSAELLPHTVYVRGFIKSYARMIGIDEDELAPYLVLFEPEEQSQPDTAISPVVQPERERSGWIFKILFVVLLVGFGGYWYYTSYFKESSVFERAEKMITFATPQQAVPPVVTEPKKTMGEQAETPKALSPDMSTQPVIVNSEKPKSTSEPTIEFNRPLSPQPVPTQATVQPSPPPSRDISAAQPSGSPTQNSASAVTSRQDADKKSGSDEEASHQVLITGLAECWVHSTADDTDTRQFSVKKNETFALSFNKNLVLKLGNAGGVKITYDGVERPEEGKSGQVKTLTFPPK